MVWSEVVPWGVGETMMMKKVIRGRGQIMKGRGRGTFCGLSNDLGWWFGMNRISRH